MISSEQGVCHNCSSRTEQEVILCEGRQGIFNQRCGALVINAVGQLEPAKRYRPNVERSADIIDWIAPKSVHNVLYEPEQGELGEGVWELSSSTEWDYYSTSTYRLVASATATANIIGTTGELKASQNIIIYKASGYAIRSNELNNVYLVAKATDGKSGDMFAFRFEPGASPQDTKDLSMCIAAEGIFAYLNMTTESWRESQRLQEMIEAEVADSRKKRLEEKAMIREWAMSRYEPTETIWLNAPQ